MAAPFKHISRHTLSVLGALLLLLVVAFFAATRTELGREAVARQLEAQFARSSSATLEIGRLTGNLVRQFTATDVRVRDALGRTILAVDTVIVRPSWEDLLRRRFDTRRVELVAPRLHLVRDSTGRGSWLDAVSAAGDGTSGWSFNSARLVARRGMVTRPAGPDRVTAVTVIDGIFVDARVEQAGSALRLDLLSAAGRGPTAEISLVEATGQAVFDSTRISVTQLAVRTGGSDLTLSGYLDTAGSKPFAIEVFPSRLSFTEVRTLRPGFPLAGEADVRVRASGTVADFVVNELEVATGASRISIAGTVLGWPQRAVVDLQASAAPLLRGDLADAVPGLGLPNRLLLDSLGARASITGTFDLPTDSTLGVGARIAGLMRGRARLQVSVDSDAGSGLWDGRLRVGSTGEELRVPADSITGPPQGLPEDGRRIARLVGSLESARVDIGEAYLTAVSTSSVNLLGTLDLLLEESGGGWSWLRGGSQGTVRQSRVGGIELDLLRFTADAAPGDVRVSGRLVQPSGATDAEIIWAGGLQPRIAVESESSGLDLGQLLGSARFATRLSGRMAATLTDPEAGFGNLSVAVDSAWVRRGDLVSSPPPQTIRLEIAPEDSVAVFRADGSHLSGRWVITESPRGFLRAARFWGATLAAAAAREMDKPYRPEAEPSPPQDDVSLAVLRDAFLSGYTGRPVTAVGSFDISDLGAATRWLPGLEAGGTGARLAVRLAADTDSLAFEVTVGADSAFVGSIAATRGLATMAVQTRLSTGVRESARIRLRAQSDTLSAGFTALPDWRFRADIHQRAGRLRTTSGRGAEIGPVLVSARTTLLDDRARFLVDTLSVSTRQLDWGLRAPSVIEVYQDAVSIDELAITESVASQRLELHGIVSSAPEDTLAVVARSLRLAEVTEFASLRRQLGGLLNADVRFTGGFNGPLMTGSIRVPGFILDDRLLGSLTLRTEIVPDRDEIEIDLRIQPAALAEGAGSAGEVIENRVRIGGRLRPPSSVDPGAWDLRAQVDRADLFFLKYIFNESVDRFVGYAAGSGTVTGPFDSPVVNADFDVRDGEFGIPLIGVRYTMDGQVRIDREAIHFVEATLRDHDGGTATLSGPLQFNDYRFFSFDVQGQLNDLLVMNRSETVELPFYGFIRGTGNASLTGPLTNATLRIPDGRTREDSELFIPIVDTVEEGDASFIIFADSTGRIPDLERLIRRPFVLARRASAERQFLAGLDMDLNIEAPRGSVIHLVIDPLLGDVINAESTGRVQIRRNQGEFEVFGQMEVLGGDYLFTAGEVFVRRFIIQPGGTLSWVGDPINARMNLSAAYRTRASATGLEDVNLGGALIPLIVELEITGLVASPQVDLGLSIDRSNQNALGDYQALEARLNQPDRATEYATSVLLTNSFQLTTDNLSTGAGEQLAFNSVSQLVSSQLSRFLDAALPNVDFNFGLQGERAEDLDITYGVALRLLDERLIIRGEGIYQGSSTDNTRANTEGIQGEFVVEVRLSPSVSAQVFFRREGDILQNADLTNTAGAGLTYQTDFPSWKAVLRRLFGFGSEEDEVRPSQWDEGGGR